MSTVPGIARAHPAAAQARVLSHQSGEGLLTIYPPEFRAWFAESGTQNVTRVPPNSRSVEVGAARRRGDSHAFAIAIPPAGAIYSVDPTLRREFQALPLRAVTARPTTVTWLVDGASIGTTSSERSLSWPLAIGAHEIEARDADGRKARTSVFVK